MISPARGRARNFLASFTAGPAYPASDADRRTFRLLGLELPLRATTAIVVMTLVVLFDFTRTAIPEDVQAIGRAAAAIRYQALERVILFGLVPGLVIVFAFRDRLADYGLRLGDWRWGLGLAVVGCAIMTPVILSVGSNAQFSAFYGVSSASAGDLFVTNLLDLIPTEFVLRGFLMFTLIRAIGPLGVVVALLPFVFIASRQARDRTLLDARRRHGLRLAQLAHPLDPLERPRPRLHPDPDHGRRRSRPRGLTWTRPLRESRPRRRPPARRGQW